jgi:DNA-binding GntR family transcriptional regulator
VSFTHRTHPGRRVAHLDEDAVRELHAAVVILESLAVRRAPPFDAARRAGLRAANARLRAARDPVTAALADRDLHARLVEPGAGAELRRTLRPIEAALQPLAVGGDARGVRRHADEHDAVIDALAEGEHARAAERLREHLAGRLPALLGGVANRTGHAAGRA